MFNLGIKHCDKDLYNLIKKEKLRQEKCVNLIASENYASLSVMKAQGSQLTNKYAEGYPEKRYYGGCKYIDLIEKIAIERAKILFDVDYANVQPHSGSQANTAVYTACLKPGDTILSMKLSHGGHLTHGSLNNLSGKLYNVISYGINKEGDIDYENLAKLAELNKPKMIIGGYSSFSKRINWGIMRKIADSVGAYFLADIAHIAGLVAAKVYPSPVPYAHIITATTHKTLSGPRGGLILSNGQDETLYRKLDSAVFPGIQGGPLMHVIAAKAIAFKEAMSSTFKTYQKKVLENAKIMSKIFLSRNFKVISGITENHLFLIDLTNLNITGNTASEMLDNVNIIVNKNSIPNDSRKSYIASGIRIGTAAVTRRGFNQQDVRKVANWICDLLLNKNNYSLMKSIKHKVVKLCSIHPIYDKNNSCFKK